MNLILALLLSITLPYSVAQFVRVPNRISTQTGSQSTKYSPHKTVIAPVQIPRSRQPRIISQDTKATKLSTFSPTNLFRNPLSILSQIQTSFSNFFTNPFSNLFSNPFSSNRRNDILTRMFKRKIVKTSAVPTVGFNNGLLLEAIEPRKLPYNARNRNFPQFRGLY